MTKWIIFAIVDVALFVGLFIFVDTGHPHWALGCSAILLLMNVTAVFRVVDHA